MNPLSFLKNAIIVVGAATVAVGGVVAYRMFYSPSLPTESEHNVLSASQKVKEVVQEKEQEHTNKVSKYIKDVLVPSIVDNPVLAPILKTTKEVNSTVETIKSLPADQRNAVCRQICGE